GYTMTYQSWSNAMQQRFPVHFADLTTAPADLAARVLPDPELPITPPDSPSRHTRRPVVHTNLCDVVIAGAILCNDRTRQGQPVERAARPLLAFAQLRVALSMLAPGGTLILVASANPNVFCLEILALVRRLFAGGVRATKGRKLHEIRSAYYIIGQGFKGANPDALRQIDEAIRTLKRRGANPSYGGSEDDDEVSSGSTPLLLHPHLTEVDILQSDGEWLLRHYEPLWTRQADALERAFARVAKSGSAVSPDADRRSTWRRSGVFSESEPQRSRKTSQRGDQEYNAMVNAFENGLNVGGAHTSSSKSRRTRGEERWM
ncbi:hypothetical protein FRC08_013771, partial [Ceratobasidium sp. 394]